MVLTLVGLSEGMLNDQASRARGVGADILIRPPGSSIIASGGQMDARVHSVDRQGAARQGRHRHAASTEPTCSITSPAWIWRTFDRLNGGFRFLAGGPFQQPDDVMVDEVYASQHKLHVGDTINNTEPPVACLGNL